jgi:hypothetical protein
MMLNMMSKLLKILSIILLAGFSSPSVSQVIVQFVPEIHGRSTDGLMWVKLNSMLNGSKTVILETTVIEKKAGRVLTISTAPFVLMPGNQSLRRDAVTSAGISFSNSNTARLVRQSSYFPEGEYEYCFRILSESKTNPEILGEQCFDHIVEPLTPLFLIEPYNKQSICDKRPVFTWQPSMPAIPGSQYRLTLAEIKPGQNFQEALVYNIPLINQSNIVAPMLLYPPSARELEESKKYAWQVTVYKDGIVLNRSEIWEFSIKCNDTPVVETATGFRDIEDLAKGNYYIAEGRVLFAISNAYEAADLQYSLICLNKPDQSFKKLPKVKLARGNNNITIDLSEKNGFKDGQHFIMTVRLPNGSSKQLRFIYKKKAE